MEKNIREREREEGRKKAALARKRRRRNALIAVLISLLLILAIAFAIVAAFVFFKVDKITVKGSSEQYTKSQIIEISDIEKEDNLLFLNKKEITEKITEKLPYIKSVKIEKKFPSSVIISVTETTTELCILSDGKYYAADNDGKILSKLDTPLENLPLFVLPKECSIKVGKAIEIEDEAVLQLLEDCMGLINQYDFKINSVDISNAYDLYLTVDNRLKVKVGSPNNFDMKMAHFNTMFKSMPKEAEGIVDLSSWTPKKHEAFFTASDF